MGLECIRSRGRPACAPYEDMNGNLMAPRCFRPPMTRERIPQDPDFAPEWRKTAIGLAISAGAVLLFVGLMLLAIAGLTEFTYQSMAVPASVQSLLATTRQTSYALLVIGVGLVVIGYIARH